MAKDRDAIEGVQSSWDFWLDQHPVSVPEIIEEAVKKAFTAFLEKHKAEVLEAIAKRVP